MPTRHEFGGPWTEDKLGRVQRYLVEYRKIFSKNGKNGRGRIGGDMSLGLAPPVVLELRIALGDTGLASVSPAVLIWHRFAHDAAQSPKEL